MEALNPWGHFGLQRNALVAALKVIRRLPADAVWSLCATEADESVALNVFVNCEADRLRIRTELALGLPVEEGPEYETYKRIGALEVSVVETDLPEENDG